MNNPLQIKFDQEIGRLPHNGFSFRWYNRTLARLRLESGRFLQLYFAKARENEMILDPDCIFCQIISGQAESSLIYKDDLVTAFLDNQPINAGHVLVAPNKHIPDLAQLDGSIGKHMFIVGQQIARALRRADLRCEGVNLFLADGTVAGQSVFHIHLHIIPRYSGDGFGFRRSSASLRKPSRAELDSIGNIVRASLNREVELR